MNVPALDVLRHGLVILILAAGCSASEHLAINSDPPGATVEINDVKVGVTPYSVEIPGGYLHGTKSVFGKVLKMQLRVRVKKDGYLPKELELANGPFRWIALNGTYHGDYWLLKTDTFRVSLDKAATAFTGTVEANLAIGATKLSSALPAEEIVRAVNPAVLLLQGSQGQGSGFLISETGVAVTNAHVAKGQDALTATTGNGQSFEAKVVYVDNSLDIALLQLKGSGFPHLVLGDINSVQAGSNVIAIGTPSKGFANSVTRGVVSGRGPLPNERGTWLQTDTAINPGNSGGPLLNGSGEVVGITTQKEFVSGDGRPLQGIGFALSSTDLLAVVQRFFPNVYATPTIAPELKGKGKLNVSADIENSEVYADGKFVGNAPANLTLKAGTHSIEVKSPGGESWKKELEVLDDSELKLNAVFKKQQ